MLSPNADSETVPQWKKDLLQRRQCRNKTATSVEQLLSNTRAPPNSSVTVGSSGQQPIPIPHPTCNGGGAVSVVGPTKPVLAKCNNRTVQEPNRSGNNTTKMVQERTWAKAFELVSQRMEKNVDSDSSEELQYGPGIVSRLKNRYLSLTLRETNAKIRPSILTMRKATSLEHLIDDDDDEIGYESDEKTDTQTGRPYETKTNGIDKNTAAVPNRYNNGRRFDMKRARSVEIISSVVDDDDDEIPRPKRESLHEEMLIIKNREGNDKTDDKKLSEINDNKTFSNTIGLRLNRPKRIAPVMNEKEKPPVDVVKQTKRLFEKPELRTKPPAPTGEVAARVATYKTIIGQNQKKPPPIKQKPHEKPKARAVKNEPKKLEPDVTSSETAAAAAAAAGLNGYGLSETPDLILHSSHSYTESATYKDATEDFLRAEISHSNKVNNEKTAGGGGGKKISPAPQNKSAGTGNSMVFNFSTSHVVARNHLPNTQNRIPLTQPLRIEIAATNHVEHNNKFSSSHSPSSPPPPQHKPPLSPKFSSKPPPKPSSPQKTSKPLSPSKIPHQSSKPFSSQISPTPRLSKPLSPQIPQSSKPPLSPPTRSSPPLKKPPVLVISTGTFEPKVVELLQEEEEEKELNDRVVIEKNLKNAADKGVVGSVEQKQQQKKQQQQQVVQTIQVSPPPKEVVPKVKRSGASRPKQEQNSLVFNFTNRKDVPDYVGNHGPIRTGKIERPKPGEGGITLLPGASLDESIVDDDDEELLRSLEGPPSPCNVTFINDNVLIDGKSSLSKKSKKPKMRIKFVEAGPDVYEYPSEASLLDDAQVPATPVGHSVPSLSGSTLANYTPKSTFPPEEFQLGMKPSVSPTSILPETKRVVDDPEEDVLNETEQPILFSAGTNSDILF